MRNETFVLFGLIILGGALLSRWVTVFGVAIASVGLGVALGLAAYGGFLPVTQALTCWALFQVAYGVTVVMLDAPARKSMLIAAGLMTRDDERSGRQD